MWLHVQLCAGNAQNKGLISEVWGCFFLKLFSPTLNSPLMLPCQQMQREIASLQNALSQQHRKSGAPAKEMEQGSKVGSLAGKKPGSRSTGWAALRKGKVGRGGRAPVKGKCCSLGSHYIVILTKICIYIQTVCCLSRPAT